MHLVTALFVLTTIATTTSALKARYYSDGLCWKPNVEVDVPANGYCYNYSYENSHSVSIASCDHLPGCGCIFFEFENCTGVRRNVDINDKNCVWNWNVEGFASMRCFEYVP
ncbi:hypothetical protein COCCADRAFT_6082 [Bipolaris zeicola 26-R-13]|uniref:Uncharacterized protein n=1 Tax=Cochliobolus carbonum (strain 26-R-13) TaxID=930089 RepID=W6Y3A5_COCC2|nr:uncharacterized protein COCCADRAFT_6082 [Bipolaris zeicola 26-R-13]EUC32110.1 hypothetical protein COCCADRAFT_6082 [Bipolaris zeicola 26-R-13]